MKDAAEAREVLRNWRRQWDEAGYQLTAMKDAGDRVLVAFDSPRADPNVRSFFQVLTFRDGKIVHIEDFGRRRKAFRAAGLRD
jgi:ketosteroid isomerase-like protein